MRKNFLMTSLAILLSLFTAKAQDVPNGSFETWLPVAAIPPYEEPQNWYTSNGLSNGSSVTRSLESSAGVFAAKLTTLVTEQDTVVAHMFSIENVPGLLYESPGFPVSPNLLALTGKYKYLPQGNDKAYIIIYITQNLNGEIYIRGYGSIDIQGEHPEYDSFEIPITYLQEGMGGDSALVMIASSFGGSITNGTSLFVDDLSMLTTTGLEYTFSGKSPGGAYPNPADKAATIKYVLKEASQVEISVMDVTGKLIYQRNEGLQEAGIRTIELNTIDLTPGVYSYTVKIGEQVSGNKLLVVH